jgi:hypothetical protein
VHIGNVKTAQRQDDPRAVSEGVDPLVGIIEITLEYLFGLPWWIWVSIVAAVAAAAAY